jgi:hypothetical protein
MPAGQLPIPLSLTARFPALFHAQYESPACRGYGPALRPLIFVETPAPLAYAFLAALHMRIP